MEHINKLRDAVARAEAELGRAQERHSEWSENSMGAALAQYEAARTELLERRLAAINAEQTLEQLQRELKKAEAGGTDLEIAADAIVEAREQGLKVINIECRGETAPEAVDVCVSMIESGERFLITFPRAYTHRRGADVADPLILDELNAEFNCPYILNGEVTLPLPKDVFFAIRCENNVIVCDLCRL